MDESSSTDDCNREWSNFISIPNKKSVKCKMLVAGQEVTFLINMLPVKYAKYGTEPYSGVLKMWNEVKDKPTGTCNIMIIEVIVRGLMIKTRFRCDLPFFIVPDRNIDPAIVK